MKLRYEKNVRILTDILGFCRFLGGAEFHVDFVMGDKDSCITVSARMSRPSDETLLEADALLNMPRQREVEQNYWNISGEEEIDGELSLVGMMTDGASLRYEDGLLIIMVRRIDSI